ncbi:hypothetical protein J437_LFUL003186 [Ladona fulva]|uniref:Uncharacterized protein n=1 Tax=Ladona fulva TaxID=123851 RepID=A0A8K0NWP4_LADFU|nr:hypothetical protein J437_LFUL003186 [Ladona fulva]
MTRKFIKKKQKARDDGNLEQWAHYCRELGELYRNSGKYQDALFQYKEEERVNGSLGNPVAVAISNRMIGEIYCDLGEYEEALKYQKKHLDIAKMENVDIEVQRALANIGRTYFCKAESLTSRQPEYNSSLACAKNAYLKSLKVCENLKGIGLLVQMEMKTRLLMNLGLVLECQDDMSKAVDYIEQAIQIAKKHELWEDLCRCYSAIGMLYQRSGNHTRALRSLNLALEVAERLDSRVKTSCEILLSKAEVLFLIADFGGARQALLKAYKLKTPNVRDRATIEKNLRIEKAGEEGQKLCPIYVSLSQTYKDDGQYDLALEYAKKELKLWLDVPQELSILENFVAPFSLIFSSNQYLIPI